jgi:cell volume regulation protein A
VHRFTVAVGSAAEGRTIDAVADLVGDMWVSIVVRDRQLVPVQADTELHAADDVVILADARLRDALTAMFELRETT